MTPTPSASGPPDSGEEPPSPPESLLTPLPWTGFDRLGFTQATGGLALGLIALFSSYDHLTFAGRRIPIPQQWGVPLIAASVAIVFTECVQYSAPLGRDAQLASRSRLRAAQDAARMADETARERYFTREERQRADRERNLAGEERQRADQERDRADRERNRTTEARERQAESIECLHLAAVLSARVQLDPSTTNRARLRAFLTLIAGQVTPEGDGEG